MVQPVYHIPIIHLGCGQSHLQLNIYGRDGKLELEWYANSTKGSDLKYGSFSAVQDMIIQSQKPAARVMALDTADVKLLTFFPKVVVHMLSDSITRIKKVC